MHKLVIPLTKLSRRSVAQAGGKGANLGELIKAKIPVPAGFVVSAEAFDRFLEETDINVEINAILKHVDLKDVNTVDRASHEIHDLIRRAEFPADLETAVRDAVRSVGAKAYAVRSSATAEDSKVASWAGELDTYLYVKPKEVSGYIKKCWASLYTPRAIFYRFEKRLHTTRVSVGVVVQQMVASKVAGVAFTVHPITKDHNQMVIEACWGLGEALVSGAITPDTYVIDRKAKALLDVNIGEQKQQILPASGKKNTKTIPVPKRRQEMQKLANAKILEVAGICERIERHYRSPQDIEWAIDSRKIYVTQTRPITTL